ncbi:hypothetical protein ACFSL6_17655 [Paenibacillus thailandensis]|uniref:Uncharacterized protein n=1 Tax=Paenibacillus thailandensis TaxID=393250 RepID=A0ABW5QT21_9BACL
MAWIAPKLDWNALDRINAVDFNRIENNTQEVANFLNSIQYTLPAMTFITNRTQTSVDTLSSINRIEENLELIRTHFMTPPGYPGAETWTTGKPFDYTDANRLELAVELLMDYGVLVYKSFRYCGAAICGETGVIY